MKPQFGPNVGINFRRGNIMDTEEDRSLKLFAGETYNSLTEADSE